MTERISKASPLSRVRTVLANAFIGLFGGTLIVMGTLMLIAVIGQGRALPDGVSLALLAAAALLVGWLARLVRPLHGLGAALASGLVAAGLILFLWLRADAVPGLHLAFTPAGMLLVVAGSSLGGWLGRRRRSNGK